jgi:hypothetical protein
VLATDVHATKNALDRLLNKIIEIALRFPEVLFSAAVFTLVLIAK